MEGEEPIGAGMAVAVVEEEELRAVEETGVEVDFSVPDASDNVVFAEDGSIKGGTVAKIVQKLTSSEANVSLLFDFLITYRSYTSPTHLLSLLKRRFEQVVETEDSKIVRIRVMNFMKQWIEKHAYDWVDDADLVTRFTTLIDSWVAVDASYQRTAATLTALIKKTTEPIEKEKKKSKTFNAPPPPPEFPSELDPAKLNIHQINTTELARQWSLLEWSLWEEIKPWEFLNCNWARKRKEALAPNIIALTKNFNKAAGWVATTILHTESLKERVKVVTKFIQLAEELRLLANFNGVMEILSGLGSAAVHRLKQTWEALPKPIADLLANLKALMSPDQSFKRYRENLKNVNPPTIPYLGISLTDLTFIYDGSKDSTASGLVNFAKCRMVAQIIKTLMQYQHTSYHFVTVPVIRDYLKYPTIWDEASQYAYSLYVEPRPGTEAPAEAPAVVCTSETAPWAGANATTYALPQKNKIVKEPPKEWKSAALVIRRGVLRAADLRHAVTHLLYIPESDTNFNSFSNTFFTAIKTFGGLQKVFEMFEQILESAPLDDPTDSDSASVASTSSNPTLTTSSSDSKKSATLPTVASSPATSTANTQESPEISSNAQRKVTKKAPSEPVVAKEEAPNSSPTTSDLKPTKLPLLRSTSNPPETSSSEARVDSEGEVASPDMDSDTPRSSATGSPLQEPYWPQKTKRELTMKILGVCVYWGTRYASPASRDQKALQLLQTWMEQRLILVEGMKEKVQGAVISFVRTIPMLGLEATRRSSVAAAPKVHPLPNVPVNQQSIRLFHPEEIARQLALWYHSEYACFTRDEVFQASAYVSSSSSASALASSGGAQSSNTATTAGTSITTSTNANGTTGNGASLSPSGSVPSLSHPSLKPALAVLTKLSRQQEKWIKAEMTAVESSKKKKLATFECLVESAQYSLDFNNFAAVRQFYTVLSDSAFESVLESSSKKTKDIWSQLRALFASPQNGSGTPVWNQRIATQLSSAPTGSSSSASGSPQQTMAEQLSPMVLPIDWLEASISHNRTERDWWKGRSGMYNFDKLSMVTQTWKALERTRQAYAFTLCPVLKDYLIAAATDAANDVGLNANSSAPTSARKRKGSDEAIVGGDEDDSEDPGTPTSATAEETEKRKSSLFKGMFGGGKKAKENSSSNPSLNVPAAVAAANAALASGGNTESPKTSPKSKKEEEKAADKEKPKTAASAIASSSNNSTPRNSRGGSASSSQDSTSATTTTMATATSTSYANTPEFRAAVLKMLQEDEDFKAFLQTALSTGSSSPTAERKRRKGSPSPSISVSSSAANDAKVALLETAETHLSERFSTH